MEPVTAPLPVPSVVNGRLSKPGKSTDIECRLQPGEKLLLELQARELGTSRLEGVITVYDADGKKLDSAGDKPLPEDVFAVQGTSRTSSDPFLNFTVPKDAHEIAVTVEDLAERGGPLYGYRLITATAGGGFQADDRFAVREYSGGRHGDGERIRRPARLRRADSAHDSRCCRREFTSKAGSFRANTSIANNARSFNRRGILIITAPSDAAFSAESTARCGAKGRSLTAPCCAVERAARGWWWTSRARPRRASWTGSVRLPRRGSASIFPRPSSEPPSATLEVKQTTSSGWRRARATSSSTSGSMRARHAAAGRRRGRGRRPRYPRHRHEADQAREALSRSHHQGYRSRRVTTSISPAA